MRPPPRHPRKFGLVMAGAFTGLFLVRWVLSGAFAWWLLGVAGAFLLAGLLMPAVLAPVDAGWMKLAGWLGAVNSRVLLTVVFGLVITPMGLLRRLFGRRSFEMYPDASCESYWRARRPEEFSRERLERQF